MSVAPFSFLRDLFCSPSTYIITAYLIEIIERELFKQCINSSKCHVSTCTHVCSSVKSARSICRLLPDFAKWASYWSWAPRTDSRERRERCPGPQERGGAPGVGCPGQRGSQDVGGIQGASGGNLSVLQCTFRIEIDRSFRIYTHRISAVGRFDLNVGSFEEVSGIGRSTLVVLGQSTPWGKLRTLPSDCVSTTCTHIHPPPFAGGSSSGAESVP